MSYDVHVGSPDRRRILLTGFGPFPGVPDNASARLVTAVAPRARARFADSRIEFEILPTEWDAGPERLREAIAAFKPDVVLSFGVAHDATGFRLETQALNVCRASPDAAGALPPLDLLIDAGPSSRPTSAPIDRIEARLRARGFPVSLSDDAGGYLCNAALYHALQCAAPGARIAFVHIPADLENGPLTLETAIDGALEILDVCISAKSVNA